MTPVQGPLGNQPPRAVGTVLLGNQRARRPLGNQRLHALPNQEAPRGPASGKSIPTVQMTLPSGGSSGSHREDEDEDGKPGRRPLRNRDDYPDDENDDPSDSDRPSGDGDDGGDDDPEVDVETVRIRLQAVLLSRPAEVKEADAVKAPPLPNPQQYRAWRSTVRSQVMAASGRGEGALSGSYTLKNRRRPSTVSATVKGTTASMPSWPPPGPQSPLAS